MSAPNDNSFLQVITEGASYLYPLAEVQEVAEMLPLRPYPTAFQGHLGVVNLRGQVVPVISLAGERARASCYSRLVIIRSGDGLLALPCSAVKKVVLGEMQLAELSETGVTNIKGCPVTRLDPFANVHLEEAA